LAIESFWKNVLFPFLLFNPTIVKEKATGK